MNKRITSFALALLMVVSMLMYAMPAFAAMPLDVTIEPNTAKASPGQEITYNVYVGPVQRLNGATFTLIIPEELTYGEGKVPDGLMETLGIAPGDGEIVYTPESRNYFFYSAEGSYTSDSKTLLFTFTCTVNEGTVGKKPKITFSDHDLGFYDYDVNPYDWQIDYDGSAVQIVSASATYTVSFNANGGSGSMTDETGVSGTYTLPVCTFTAPTGKQFKGWATSAGGTVIAGSTIEVTADTTLYAIWEDVPAATYTVSFDANGGSGTMADETGISGTYTLPSCAFTAPAGKQFKGWATSAGGTVITGTTIDVTANTTLYAIWENIPTGGGGGGITTYTITVKDAENGNVTASHKSAARNTTVTLTVTPDKGYVLDALKVLDSRNQEIKLTEKNGKYTFSMPAGKVTVEASFKAEAPVNPFTDVPEDSWYKDAVIWAVNRDITSGTSATTFAPDGICTRAQAVTFLWRTAGAPAPKAVTMPFTDVEAGSWYYDAVLWAAESGIIKGTSATTFSPDMNCSRAQIVTLLYRAAGSPAVSDSAAFADVAADAYYADAVAWADEKGITTGIGGGLFGSDNNCTRAQIVTFIYRYMEK